MICYEKYAPHRRRDVIALLDLLWGWSDPKKSTVFFDWRYEDNPYTTAPAVFIARDGDRVVGLRCYVVQKFRRGADTVLVACPADAIVHPDYRRLGLFYDLTQFSIEHMLPDVRIILSLSANRASAAANRKIGWTEFGTTKYMHRIRLPGFTHRNGEQSTRNTRLQGSNFRILECPETPTPSTHAFPQIDGAQFANARDEAYYAWRYRQPFAKFSYLAAQEGEQRGYLILRSTAHRQFSVMDYGFDSTSVLSRMVEGFTRASRAYSLRLLNLTLRGKEAAAFRHAGFRNEPHWLIRLLHKHRAGALVHLMQPDKGPGSSPALRVTEIIGEDRWHIVLGDVH